MPNINTNERFLNAMVAASTTYKFGMEHLFMILFNIFYYNIFGISQFQLAVMGGKT